MLTPVFIQFHIRYWYLSDDGSIQEIQQIDWSSIYWIILLTTAQSGFYPPTIIAKMGLKRHKKRSMFVHFSTLYHVFCVQKETIYFADKYTNRLKTT